MVGALYSINRPHTDNIRSRTKLWEIRISKPNIPVPFPAFIYETKRNGGCGKVIGEFTCDEIKNIDIPYPAWNRDYLKPVLEQSCLTYQELHDYGGSGNTVYGLHISDLKIYDKPKELSEFYSVCNKYNQLQKSFPTINEPVKCKCCRYRYIINCFLKCRIDGKKPLTRPPLSWCYVEI